MRPRPFASSHQSEWQSEWRRGRPSLRPSPCRVGRRCWGRRRKPAHASRCSWRSRRSGGA
eukprot:9234763-Alexandrium_andersonii.AAC.1